MKHKAGFVNILGLPNAGKSTLMNALTGERLSIITSKAQTTRHRILGIVNGAGFQVVFSDTPGIVRPQSKLHLKMMKSIGTAIEDADVTVLVHDIHNKQMPDKELLGRIAENKAPVVLVFNKTDMEDGIDRDMILQKW
ncbi:MAG: GTPase, partial [Saprospiraceae bacterium]